MKRLVYVLMFTLVLMLGCVGTACADFAERPVGLVVMDYGRNVDTAFYRQNIYAPVKWAYHFPYYKIHDDEQLTQNLSTALKDAKVTPELLGQLCEQNKMDVLVVAKIYQTAEYTVPSIGFRRDGPEMLTRVICMADLYCYRNDTHKLLKKNLHENYLTDNNGHEAPRDTVKWQLSKLVNTMEGRPIIGGDN